MIKYTEATSGSYGYLFIDVRQSTPVENILKADIFNSVLANKRCSPNMVGSRVDEYINRDTREVGQFEDKPQNEQTYFSNFEKDHRNIEEKMPSFDDCGLMFGNISDFAKHMNRWCPENQRKPTFERNLSTKIAEFDHTECDVEAKAQRWFMDNTYSGRGVKRSIS